MSVKKSHYWPVRARCRTFVFDLAKAFPRLSPWQCCKNSEVLMSNAALAVTRIRTKVAAATTQSTNHYTITESHEEKHLPLGCTSALFTGTSIPVIHRNRHFGSRPYLEMPSQLIALFSPPLSNILPLANKPKGTKIVSLRAIFQTWCFLSWLLTLVESLLSLPLLIHAVSCLVLQSVVLRPPAMKQRGWLLRSESYWFPFLAKLVRIFGCLACNLASYQVPEVSSRQRIWIDSAHTSEFSPTRTHPAQLKLSENMVSRVLTSHWNYFLHLPRFRLPEGKVLLVWPGSPMVHPYPLTDGSANTDPRVRVLECSFLGRKWFPFFSIPG